MGFGAGSEAGCPRWEVTSTGRNAQRTELVKIRRWAGTGRSSSRRRMRRDVGERWGLDLA